MPAFPTDPCTCVSLDTLCRSSSSIIGSRSAGSDASLWAGLGSLFSTIGTTVATDFRAVSGAGTTPRPIAPGTYYNPATGQVQQVGVMGLGGSSGMLLLIGGALLLVLLLRRLKDLFVKMRLP